MKSIATLLIGSVVLSLGVFGCATETQDEDISASEASRLGDLVDTDLKSEPKAAPSGWTNCKPENRIAGSFLGMRCDQGFCIGSGCYAMKY